MRGSIFTAVKQIVTLGSLPHSYTFCLLSIHDHTAMTAAAKSEGPSSFFIPPVQIVTASSPSHLLFTPALRSTTTLPLPESSLTALVGLAAVGAAFFEGTGNTAAADCGWCSEEEMQLSST
mmetsp:Transcript_21624/g.57724  ORF Transcript_21624/g.57724 Transcript_21624/m.57724 type:complete len:121 (+) Transcript_21624:178-540(+)